MSFPERMTTQSVGETQFGFGARGCCQDLRQALGWEHAKPGDRMAMGRRQRSGGGYLFCLGWCPCCRCHRDGPKKIFIPNRDCFWDQENQWSLESLESLESLVIFWPLEAWVLATLLFLRLLPQESNVILVFSTIPSGRVNGWDRQCSLDDLPGRLRFWCLHGCRGGTVRWLACVPLGSGRVTPKDSKISKHLMISQSSQFESCCAKATGNPKLTLIFILNLYIFIHIFPVGISIWLPQLNSLWSLGIGGRWIGCRIVGIHQRTHVRRQGTTLGFHRRHEKTSSHLVGPQNMLYDVINMLYMYTISFNIAGLGPQYIRGILSLKLFQSGVTKYYQIV